MPAAMGMPRPRPCRAFDASGDDATKKEIPDDASQDTKSLHQSLHRVETKRSLASEALEQRRANEEPEKKYSFFYLFMRMGKINRSHWKMYLIGTIAAASKPSIPLAFSDHLLTPGQ